jgi:hypothetical protein
MSHDQFGKIPQSPEMQEKILMAELQSVEDNLETLRMSGKDISGMMLKGLEKRKANLEAKLVEISSKINSRTDDFHRLQADGHRPPVYRRKPPVQEPDVQHPS